MPDANPLIPPPPNANEWFTNASGVAAVIGSVDGTGSPFLMRSASVSGVLPPPTSWEQWRADMLAGEPLDGMNDDPDGDGLPNLLEFAFGSDPQQLNTAPAMPLTLENFASQKFLQISVARRKDHVISLTVQVSSDLVAWDEGEIIDDGLHAFIVRDPFIRYAAS